MTDEKILEVFNGMTDEQKECVSAIAHKFANSMCQAMIFKSEAVRRGFLATGIDSELLDVLLDVKKETK